MSRGGDDAVPGQKNSRRRRKRSDGFARLVDLKLKRVRTRPESPVEGRLMHGEQGLDVGDRLKVTLIGTNPERGYIDFERIS